MKNTKITPLLIKKDQLYSERAFIRHCIHDYHHSKKLDGINAAFLRAAEADGLLEPLLKIEEDDRQQNGNKISVSYYSPHQIFIIAALAKNRVHDGLLWGDFENLDYYKQQNFRVVNWGSGHGFNITLLKQQNKSNQEIHLNYLNICNDFHKFLKLLHSLEQMKYSTSGDRNRDRFFSEAPSLYFDMTLLKDSGESIIKKHGLDLKKLKILTYSVASLASHIDPLEHWYYYINRHPQWRKDTFKGYAALAQDLYRIYDLLIEVTETISKEKQPLIFDFLYGEQNIQPYLIPKTEFIKGTDVKSMWAAIKKFKEWMAQNHNKKFVDKATLISLEEFEKELKEYENKYGARSYISNGVRAVEIEEKIQLSELDSKTKQHVSSILQQAELAQKEGKHQFLSLWDDELKEQIERKEISIEEAQKKDRELFIKREIANAIDFRLDDLKRKLHKIFNNAYEKIAKNANDAWDIEHNFGNYYWFKNKEKLKRLSREKQLEFYKVEYAKVYKEAMSWSKKRDDFARIESISDLLFCSACRQKPVIIHQSYHDAQISNQAICDECLQNTKVLRNMKKGEWKCDYCGKLLYKFAYGNILDDITFNTAPIRMKLEYGRLEVKIKCPNPECFEENIKWIEWGWIA